MTLEYEWQKEEQKRQEEPEAHTPPETEFEFLALVQNGDIRGVNANLSQRKFRQIALVTPLSKNMLQNFRYHSVVTIALMTRFCIDGGMPMEQAYRISDFYIQKIDEAGNLDQVEMLHNAACRDFTQRMGEVRKRPRQRNRTASKLPLPSVPGADALHPPRIHSERKGGERQADAAIFRPELCRHRQPAGVLLPEPFYTGVLQVHWHDSQTVSGQAFPE